MKHNSSGFSLVEVLVTLVVITLGTVAVLSFQGSATQESASATVRAEATALANQQLIQLQTMIAPDAFAKLASNTDGTLADNKIQGKTAVFTRTWQVTPTPSGDNRVDVVVSWLDNAQYASTQQRGPNAHANWHAFNNKGLNIQNDPPPVADNNQVVATAIVQALDVVRSKPQVEPIKPGANPCVTGPIVRASHEHEIHTKNGVQCFGSRPMKKKEHH